MVRFFCGGEVAGYLSYVRYTSLYRYTVFVAVGPVEGYIDLPPNTRSESVTGQVIAVSIS